VRGYSVSFSSRSVWLPAVYLVLCWVGPRIMSCTFILHLGRQWLFLPVGLGFGGGKVRIENANDVMFPGPTHQLTGSCACRCN
jgi:hypothetical protein